jgi:HlyD family secretion protein
MPTDNLLEKRSGQRLPSTQPLRRRKAGKWWKRSLIAMGVMAASVSAVALMLGASDSTQKIGTQLTHTIARGDLMISVVEQGTLESSENTEIKCKVRGQSTVIWVVEGGTEVNQGDELVRLDTLAIEDAINERSKYALWTRSGAERARANVVRAELAIPEYLEGRYLTQLMTLEKDIAIGQSNLRTAENMLAHAEMLAERGYVSELEVEEKTFAVTKAELYVDVKETQIDVLKRYTKAMQLETLKGNLKVAKARLKAEDERSKMDDIRRDQALEELEFCVIKAERKGLVIHPSTAQWKQAPEIEEGATVHKDQTLLLMPDLAKMQVTVGIHESIVDRIKPGLAAKVTLPDRTLNGKVASVALVTRPAGWWTGNVVKYDTIIELPAEEGLKPGMSADVEVVMEQHTDVLTLPVAAVLETVEGDFCWIKTADGAERCSLQLGDTDDSFIVIKAGLKEGDEVVLNPLGIIEEAQLDALKSFNVTTALKSDSVESIPEL